MKKNYNATKKTGNIISLADYENTLAHNLQEDLEDYDTLDFLYPYYKLYLEELNSRSDHDYEINQIQMNKLLDAYAFFELVCKKSNGSLESLELIPHIVNGGITAYFTVFYLDKDDLIEFSQIVQNMGALSIDSLIDGTVCISFTVPNVYYKK